MSEKLSKSDKAYSPSLKLCFLFSFKLIKKQSPLIKGTIFYFAQESRSNELIQSQRWYILQNTLDKQKATTFETDFNIFLNIIFFVEFYPGKETKNRWSIYIPLHEHSFCGNKYTLVNDSLIRYGNEGSGMG